jgi:uncharacterized membrane protein (UPF0127 family)
MKTLRLLPLVFLCACASYQTASVKLPDGFVVKAQLADTPQKTERGLMHRKKMAQNAGMLFIFEQNDPRVFWMKNTLISLDIIFVLEDKTVHSVAARVPRSYVYTPDHQVAYVQGFGKYVLELNAGAAAAHGIEAGSKLDFDL